jgi:hypothetical protein
MDLMPTEVISPDHLFISYASEDLIFADWLALKLASEGYKVWYDRIKLLGGESYPRDITAAIKNQTFRVLALLSRNSIGKPNPVKERTLALNIGKERKIDFLIPINVDGLKATDLDFMTSDLTFMRFDKSWFEGICALLKKLEQIHAPKNQIRGQQVISKWLFAEEQPKMKTEMLWSNLIPILEMPMFIRKYKVTPEVDVESIYPSWSFIRESETILWAFGLPEVSPPDWLKEVDRIDLQNLKYYSGRNLTNLLTTLIRQSIELYALSKGLKSHDGFLYFPDDLIPKNRLYFTRYDGIKSYVKVVGQRRFKIVREGNVSFEKSTYHLSFGLRFFIDLFGNSMIRLRISVFWTDQIGNLLEPNKSNRRRKALCRRWWNYEWLSRLMTVLQWFGKDQDELTITETDSGNLRIGLRPISFHSDVGIDEDSLPKIEHEDDSKVIVEDAEEYHGDEANESE